ncbi:MAG: hypothetical protein ACI8RZ_006248 [Myxococcota bacterium]|jgi:hypothetical protein
MRSSASGVLPSVHHHTDPFPHFTAEDTLPAALLTDLDALFAADLPWVHHRDAFYRAWLCDVSTRIAAPMQAALVGRMRVITGLPLTDRLQVTVQRMEPGQYAGPHTDRPLLGYEVARLIVQLSEDWRVEHGGVLHLHRDVDGAQTVTRRPPRFNTGFGFVMGPRSFHSVQPTTVTRRTAVFNFWHIGNTEALAETVRQQLAGLRFDHLPRSLDDLISESEQSRPEDDSFRAGCIAALLCQWGFSEPVIRAGYRAGLDSVLCEASSAPVRIAAWVQWLQHERFDVSRWSTLAPALLQARQDPRLTDLAVLLGATEA